MDKFKQMIINNIKGRNKFAATKKYSRYCCLGSNIKVTAKCKKTDTEDILQQKIVELNR